MTTGLIVLLGLISVIYISLFGITKYEKAAVPIKSTYIRSYNEL